MSEKSVKGHWLMWAAVDLENGLGGVETHARCVARELRKRGWHVSFSSHRADLFSDQFDVIQTHGSSLTMSSELKLIFEKIWRKREKIRVHTLHGLTHQRMRACGEFFWPGGYGATVLEQAALFRSDLVFSIHPLLLRRKSIPVCSNGWDVADSDMPREELPLELQERLSHLGKSFFAFVGRGEDIVKGADRVQEWVKGHQDIRLVAVPGSGFEPSEQVIRTGVLSPSQVATLLDRSRGLILLSRYEGLPLVVLEALARGVPVAATNVGGIKSLSSELKGLFKIEVCDANQSSEDLRRFMDYKPQESSAQRACHNRQFLKTWSEVAGDIEGHVIMLQSRPKRFVPHGT